MKQKISIVTVFALMLSVSAAFAADRYVNPSLGTDGAGVVYFTFAGANDCLDNTSGATMCKTVWQALQVADPGDTIILADGDYYEGEILITKDFITIRGSNYASARGAKSGGSGGAAYFRGYDDLGSPRVDDGFEYIFGIQAHNVTIEGIDIETDAVSNPAGFEQETWAGVRIMPGGWDRWTIRNNAIGKIDDKFGSDTSNFSYGVYGDAQTSTGSQTMTGGEIVGNIFYELGNGTHLIGANITAGVGVYLEGIKGDVSKCDAINRFLCGAWIHGNQFEDLKTGQNQLNFGVTDPGGKEYSVGVMVKQDDENALPNSGVLVGGNDYFADDVHLPNTDLEIGVHIAIGGSIVNEANVDFNGGVTAYVLNEGRKATIEELPLADFYKTLFPRVYGEGSDMYFETELNAKNASDDEATIVWLDNFNAAPVDQFRISVEARGSSASYKVSLDNDGQLNVRQGARLLFDGALGDATAIDGVTEIVLDGTAGEDLLTIDFNNGNPTPRGTGVGVATAGIIFDGMDGFDRVVLRGDEQLQNQSIVMTGVDSGDIWFEPTTSTGLALDGGALGTSTRVAFSGLEPIDDLLIVNGAYAVIAPDDTNNEINIINGPFRFGFDTFQINSGQDATFEEINFANKKNVHVYGAQDGGGTDNDDVFTLFTEDGYAPDLLLTVNMYGSTDAADAGEDYFVVRPSQDFLVNVDGGAGTNDWFFLDCANTHADCNPTDVEPVMATYSGLSGQGYQDVTITNVESSAEDIPTNIVITKELVGFAADGAHPGDEIEFKVTIKNLAGANHAFNDNTVWISDVIDHRLSLVEQSVVVEVGSVQVVAGNTSMLWMIDDPILFEVNDEYSMTYTVIVNTLITTDDVDNFASILNGDTDVAQHDAVNAIDDHYALASLDVLDVFGFPVKAAIQSSLFYETEAGPRYMVGLYAGAKDPAQGNLGSMLCRVPDTNQAVGWDGGLGNLWYTCGEGLPSKGGLFSPLVVTDLYLDSAGRIWLTSWGFDGLYFSDDGAQTWQSAQVDLSGGQGGAPDGLPDGFAQIYSITEDILGTLFISANNGDMYRSFDRGVTWQKAKQLPLGSADTAFSLEADPTVPGKLYAGTFGDGLYITTDFAETWQKPGLDGLLNGYVFDIEIDPISGNLFVGTAKGIFYSSDEGDNWSGLNAAFPFPTNPPEIRNIAFDVNGALFASTWGQGVWSSLDWQAASLSEFALKTGNVLNVSISNGFVHVLTDTGATFRFAYEGRASSVDTEELTVELPQGYALQQNYPNPFNPTTSIAFSLPQSAQINLTVYDVLGRRVATLVNGQLAAGQHTVQFEASNLPSGMYLYRLSTPTGSITQKMMLLK
jgi:uncharacterized repeat protein (TIGR01451 family)